MTVYVTNKIIHDEIGVKFKKVQKKFLSALFTNSNEKINNMSQVTPVGQRTVAVTSEQAQGPTPKNDFKVPPINYRLDIATADFNIP